METLHDPQRRGFASDNYSGIHPEVLAAIAAANGGHDSSYGADVYTRRLHELFEDHLGGGIEVYPVFNGTGANVTALQAMLPRWGAVISPVSAHINTDEGGAPERVGGLKLLTVPTPDGKLTPELIDREAWGWGNEHRPQPLVVSLTQSTEIGTLYTPEELRAVCDHAHARGMRVHVDGARIANAAAALGMPLGALTRDVGVDVLVFGGTKNGAMLAEAIVVLEPDAAPGLSYLRKLDMQLASKMRFVSAQLIALLEDGLWLRTAAQANAMAARLRHGIEAGLADGSIRDVSFLHPTQANGVFAVVPEHAVETLRARHRFYDWPGVTGEGRAVRWVCSFDTTADDVDAFVASLAELT